MECLELLNIELLPTLLACFRIAGARSVVTGCICEVLSVCCRLFLNPAGICVKQAPMSTDTIAAKRAAEWC